MSATSGAEPTRPRVERRWLVVLLAILVVATALRGWKLGWGLEHQLAFPDELAFWKSYLFAFQPPRWQSLFGHSLFYPPLYGYLSGIAIAALSAPGWVAQGDLWGALLVARSVSVVAGVGTVAVVALLGRRAYGPAVGLVAAAFMAAIPLEAMQTHYTSSDCMLGAASALVLLAGHGFTRDRRVVWAVASGASVALAFAVKYNAIVFAAVPAWVLLEVLVAERAPRRALLLGVAVAAGAVAGLAVFFPPLFFETAQVLKQVRWINFMSTAGNWLPANTHVTPSVGWYGRPYLYQLVATMPFALGWPLAIAALAGVAVAVRRRTAADRVILVALVVYFFLLGRTNVAFARYLMPLFPGLAVLAARAVLAPRWPVAARGAVVVAIVAYSLALGFSQVARFSYDQQLGVARWIAGTFPSTSHPRLRVVVPEQMQSYFQLAEPLARVGIKQRTAKPGSWLDGSPEIFVMPEWAAISIRRDAAKAAQRADLDALESGAAGYVEVARWRSTYLQESFYTWLDPAFASDLTMGDIGFTVYAREDLVRRAPAPAPDRR